MHSAVRFGVPLIAATHACLLAWHYVPEIGACQDMRLPPEQVTDDIQVVLSRNARADAFDLVSVFELVAMCIAAFYCILHRNIDSAFQLLPGLLLVTTLVVRLRHIGPLGCSSGDAQCCANLGCPDKDFTIELAGCMSQFTGASYGYLPIEWSRTSFCSIPCWYSDSASYSPDPDMLQCKNVVGNVQKNCGGLYGTPDVASCYRYGCSVNASPIPYYGVRMLTANVILFVLLSFAALIDN